MSSSSGGEPSDRETVPAIEPVGLICSVRGGADGDVLGDRLASALAIRAQRVERRARTGRA